MELSLADQYYLKALDHYPFDMEEAIENLNYAISYNDEHAPAKCMMGRVYMYYIKDYDAAGRSFYQALQADINYPDTYKYFSLLRIWEGSYDRALTIIERGFQVKAMDITMLLINLALIHEYKREWRSAKIVLKRAKLISTDQTKLNHIDTVLKRIKSKAKSLKVNKKAKKKAKKE